MGCFSCSQKAQAVNAQYHIQQERPSEDCAYTVEYLQEKLEEQLMLLPENQNRLLISYLKSALSVYHKDCTMFAGYV